MATFRHMTSMLALGAALAASPAMADDRSTHAAAPQAQVETGQQIGPAQSTVGAPAAGSQAPLATEADQAAADEAGIGDIVVTAQRRSESLQRVPASVEVLSGAQLQAAHISNLASVQEVSPSLIVTQSSNPSAGVFTVRGIGTAVTDRGFEQSVGVYIDGVFRGRPGAALQDLLDIERVEVLRGPQSTLFGRNNAAGAINITTSLPDLNALGVYAEGTYGNYDAVQARLSVSVPIVTDKLALRVAFAENYRDGYLDAPILPRGNTNSQDRQSVRAQLYWSPSDDTQVRLIGDYSQLNDRCCSYLPLFVSDTAANLPFVFNQRGGFFGFTPPTPGTRGVSPTNPAVTGTLYRPFDRVTTQGNPSTESSNDKGVSLQIDQAVGSGLTVTAIGALRRYETDISLDIDGVNSRIGNTQSTPSSDIKENSLEVRLQNASGGPLEFVVGGYYFDQRIVDRNVLNASVFPANLTVTFFDSTGVGKAESGAAFGQATYNLTSSLRVTGGLRYLNESKSSVVTVAPGTFSFPGSVKRNDDALMGTGSIAFQPSREANFYLRYSRGFKSGGTNLLLTVPQAAADPSVDPETTDAYEAGAKLRLFDGKLNTNVAVYTQTVKDQQVQAFNTLTSSFVTLNAANVRSRGVEADVLFRPVTPLTFSGSVSYLDAEYRSFPGAPPVAGGTATQDLTGRTPPNAPRWTLVGGVALDQPISDSIRLIGNVSLRHATGYYTDLPLSAAFRNGNTDILNANVELALANGFGLQFWGRNITKQNYYLSGIGTPGGAGSLSAFVNEPRTYGVTLRFRH